ncbi:hypothetical protein NE237_009842 [Protea cynaroides]|uniref:Transmembrane protein n=1 Tax=Protea cynaroides TaxID=273540 RepID=A0A9Q0R114_9MAGN|nr:hypothetical protein NE237_009842 [Protea cynaroides]
MSTTTAHKPSILLVFLFLILLVLSPPDDDIIKTSSLKVALATRLLAPKSQNYMNLQPKPDHKKHVFHGGEIKNCMPKGIRHSSAPSRYVNNHILGSTLCDSDKHYVKP